MDAAKALNVICVMRVRHGSEPAIRDFNSCATFAPFVRNGINARRNRERARKRRRKREKERGVRSDRTAAGTRMPLGKGGGVSERLILHSAWVNLENVLPGLLLWK